MWHIFWQSIGIYSGSLSGIYSGILSGRCGPAVPTELGRSQVEVQPCPLGSEGPRLRSSGANWARKVPGWSPIQWCPLRSEPCGWSPAVPTQIGSRQLRSSSAHCARKLAKRLAKSWRGGSGHGSGGRGGGGEGGGGRGGGGGGGGGGAGTAVIKSKNPHLAGGEFELLS